MRRALALLVVLLAAPVLAGCVGEESNPPTPTTPTDGGGTTPPPTPTPPSPEPEPEPQESCNVTPATPADLTPKNVSAGFESGRGGFVPDCAFPVEVEGASWNVTSAPRAAKAGEGGLALSVNGTGTGGVVWVERVLRVPDGGYGHTVDLTFSMRGEGEAVAFVGLRSPYRLEHFTPNPDGSTSIPGALHLRETLPADGEWRTFRLGGTAVTSGQGLLYVAVGFARTGAGPTEAHLDEVRFTTA